MSFFIENLLKDTKCNQKANNEKPCYININNNIEYRAKCSENSLICDKVNKTTIVDTEANLYNKTIYCPSGYSNNNNIRNLKNADGFQTSQTLKYVQGTRIVAHPGVDIVNPKPYYYNRENVLDSLSYATQMNCYYSSIQPHYIHGGSYTNHSSPLERDYTSISGVSYYRNRRLNNFEFSRYLKPYKRKGGQIRFTSFQTEALEKKFTSNKYLSPDDRKEIADLLTLSDRQVKTWFQNRRAKWRKTNQPDEHSALRISDTDENEIIVVQ